MIKCEVDKKGNKNYEEYYINRKTLLLLLLLYLGIR